MFIELQSLGATSSGSLERVVEALLLRQIRTLKIAVGVLSIAVVLLLINSVHPLIHTQRIGVLDAER